MTKVTIYAYREKAASQSTIGQRGPVRGLLEEGMSKAAQHDKGY